MGRRIDDILGWIKTSSFVCDSNGELDMYLLKSDAKGKLRSGQVVGLVDWLERFGQENEIHTFYKPIKLGNYYLTNGYILGGSFSGYSVLEKIQRITSKKNIEHADLDTLATGLAQFEQVSSDPDHAISLTDGILAYEDKRSGLIWDTGRVFVSRKSSNPEDMSPLLNEFCYAGYDDWRIATQLDLSTIFSREAPHVIHPLSLIAPATCWASFYQFLHKNKDRDYFCTRTGAWHWDGYYSDKSSPDAGFMYVRGEVQVSEEEWKNKLAHWLSLNEPYSDIYIANDWQNIGTKLPKMKSIAVYCNDWNEVPTLPAELIHLKELEELSFNCCRRESEGADVDFDLIFNIRSLNALILEWNEITAIPPEIRNLSLLRKLNLECNLIESLPFEISELNFLTEIDLNRNKFTDLPKEVFACQSLECVNLNSNLIRNISEVYSSETLKSLDLSSNKLETIPRSINKLDRLMSLDLSHNKLETLPAEIGQLSALRSLNLRDNYLRSLPEEIGSLKNLEELDISATKIELLPKSIVNLKNLKEITLNLPDKWGSKPVRGWPKLSLSQEQIDWLGQLVDGNNCRVDSNIKHILENS